MLCGYTLHIKKEKSAVGWLDVSRIELEEKHTQDRMPADEMLCAHTLFGN